MRFSYVYIYMHIYFVLSLLLSFILFVYLLDSIFAIFCFCFLINTRETKLHINYEIL